MSGSTIAASKLASSNSQLSVKTDHPQAREVGIDTWRLLRRLESDRDLDGAIRLCDARGGRGLVASAKVAGHTVGVIPAHRVLFCEGHPAVEGLAAPADLVSAEDRMLAALDAHGWPVGRDAGVSRLDTTVTLGFSDHRAGLMFLAGLGAVDFPRSKPEIIGRPVETVYGLAERSGRRLWRAYDDGRHRLTARPGERIRLEDQGRFNSRSRRSVRAVSDGFPRERFAARFAPVALSASGLVAGTVDVLQERVVELVESGELTKRRAETLLGHIVLQGSGIRQSVSTEQRRRRQLREAGLVLGDPFSDPIAVDVAAGIEEAVAAWERDGTRA